MEFCTCGLEGPRGKDAMKRYVAVSLGLLALFGAGACKGLGGAGDSAPAAGAELKTEDEKTLYAIGLMLGKNLAPLKLTPAETDIVRRGLGDTVAGQKPLVDLEAYAPKVQAFAQKRAQAAASAMAGPEKEKGKAFVEKAAHEPGAVKTPTGLVFTSLSPGKGKSPAATDVVRVNYRGTLVDGTEFDSSASHGGPAQFPLNGVIACWTEGVQLMKVGGKAKLVCPAELAYGDAAQGKIPSGATLVFEVELLDAQVGK
jgi:FKBP-type peptidyl-prolyl cis-trans isomerase FkpA